MSDQLALPFPEWLPIPGYEGLYEISNFGTVRRADTYRMRKLLFRKTGYVSVELSKGNMQKKYFVHRLVALVFKGARPEGMQVNHKNGIRHDNRPENLEYVTPSENIRHSVNVLGTHVKNVGSSHPMAKLTESDVLAIRMHRKAGVTAAAIALQFNVSERTVMRIVKGQGWTHIN